MRNQSISKGFSSYAEVSQSNATRKTIAILSRSLAVIALCYLTVLLAGFTLPAQAEIITGGSVVWASGTVSVTTPSGNNGWDWAGLPQNNPDQITVNSTSNAYGPFFAYLDFASAPSTEYGITWNMTNASGFDWYSMHFTWSYSPQGDLSLSFDKSGSNPSTPGNTVGYSLDNWSDTNIDFSGGAINGVNGTATFYLPLDVLGHYHTGTLSVLATPDYNPTPEPNSMLLLGSGTLGIGVILRRRFLG